MVPKVSTTLLTVALAVNMCLAVETRILLPVVATVVVALIVIAVAPSPADENGRPVTTAHTVPTLVGGSVAAAIAYYPLLLLGASTRSSLDGLQAGSLAGLVLGVAAGQLTAMVTHVASSAARAQLVRSLGVTASLTTFAACACGWIGAARSLNGPDMVVIACAALVGGLVVSAVPGRRLVVTPLALAAGTVAAAATAHWAPGVSAPLWLAASAGFVVIGVALLSFAVGDAWILHREQAPGARAFPAALAFALVGPVVYVAGDFLSALG